MFRAQPLARKLLILHSRRDVRVVEGARLESVCRGNSTEGSNPSLSAILRRTLASRAPSVGRPKAMDSSRVLPDVCQRSRVRRQFEPTGLVAVTGNCFSDD